MKKISVAVVCVFLAVVNSFGQSADSAANAKAKAEAGFFESLARGFKDGLKIGAKAPAAVFPVGCGLDTNPGDRYNPCPDGPDPTRGECTPFSFHGGDVTIKATALDPNHLLFFVNAASVTLTLPTDKKIIVRSNGAPGADDSSGYSEEVYCTDEEGTTYVCGHNCTNQPNDGAPGEDGGDVTVYYENAAFLDYLGISNHGGEGGKAGHSPEGCYHADDGQNGRDGDIIYIPIQ